MQHPISDAEKKSEASGDKGIGSSTSANSADGKDRAEDEGSGGSSSKKEDTHPTGARS